MIKNILLFGLLGIFNLSILQAQDTKPEIQVNLDDLNIEDLNESERILINILVQKEVKKLEKEIEKLHTDKQFGRITSSEYEHKKQVASAKITDKIGRSVDILTNTEFLNTDVEIMAFDSLDMASEDSIQRIYYSNYLNFRTNLYKNKKISTKRNEISIALNKSDSYIAEDTTNFQYKTSISGNFGFGFINWLDKDKNRYDDPLKKLSSSSSWYYEIGLKANSYLDKNNKRLSIDYGITLISRYYHFNNSNYSINHSENGIALLDNVQITESVFSQTALEFPLSITHRFTKDYQERIAISIGVYGGINIRSRQKILYAVNNEDYKAKWFGDFNSNRFYSGAKASIGYNSIYFIARYNFSQLFKSSSDIAVYPLSLGISFGL